MGQLLHGSATTTETVRRAIQNSQERIAKLARRYNLVCHEHDIEHRLTKINHPWTNGQVERMNRTIKEATVKRYHYSAHEQLKAHLQAFLKAYNFAKRLKTLKGLTPYEKVIEGWHKEPERFIINPLQHTAGL